MWQKRQKTKIFIFQNATTLDAVNQFPFYLLPLRKQEMFKILLIRVQHGVKIKMGPFRELIYETVTDVRDVLCFFSASILLTNRKWFL